MKTRLQLVKGLVNGTLTQAEQLEALQFPLVIKAAKKEALKMKKAKEDKHHG